MTLPKMLRNAKILAQQELAPRVFFLVVEAPDIAQAAEPGQFVQLRIPLGEFILRGCR